MDIVQFKSALMYSPQFSADLGRGSASPTGKGVFPKKSSIIVAYFCYSPLSTFDPHPIFILHPTIFQMKPKHVHVQGVKSKPTKVQWIAHYILVYLDLTHCIVRAFKVGLYGIMGTLFPMLLRIG